MRLRASPSRRAPWLAALLSCGLAGTAGAQGFGLSEIGTCAVGRGFAVTAAPCSDASVIFWNPAAAATLPRGYTLTVGAANINARGHFTADSTGRRYAAAAPPAIVPHAFFNIAGDRVAAGLGMYVPFGLTSQWGGGDFPGRFTSLKASLRSIYVQPNVAVRLTPDWQIGAGPVFGFSHVELIQAVDLSQQVAAVVAGKPVTFGQLGIPAQTDFARAQLTGDGTATGYNVGVHGRVGPLSIGARYLSALDFRYQGAKVAFRQVPTGLVIAANNPLGASPVPLDVLLAGEFSGNGALTTQQAGSRIRNPWQAQGGLGLTGLGSTLSAEVARIGWSSFDQLPVTFYGNAASTSRVLYEDYRDSWAYRFGAEHTVQSIAPLRGLTARVGYSYTETPAPDVTVTPLLPDADRQNFSLGLGFPVVGGHLDAAYLHVSTPGRRGRVVERTSLSQTASQLNSGAYDLAANVASLTYTVSF